MRILITGAGGFIGSTLADHFIEDGHDVWGIDNFSTGRWENFEKNQGWELHHEDFQWFALREDQPRTELIIHCAASYKDPDDWEEDISTNVGGGRKAARLAQAWGAHLIYFQTILPPVSSYAISKIAAEQYMRLSGVDLTVLRLANIYGPRNLSGPIPVFYKRLTSGQPCVVVNTTREMVFIEDLVRAVKQVVTERDQRSLSESGGCYGWPVSGVPARHPSRPR
jgi:UDP-glucose 4-epimerase